jgi:hypothetical protein
VAPAVRRTPAEAGHRLEDGDATISTTLAAALTNEARLKIGQAQIIGPGIAADGNGVAAALVCAVDQQPAHTHVAHVGKRNLGGPVHAP